ncbi:hypothetical protein H0I31_02440 [Tenacibaculum sp. AHE15PA]|uniref:hypothetical protein n=2 Tax=Tenacibaculum TaxID=104267 RepID=UPI001C4FBFCC|nr:MULTISPECIES: hypothetical protein [unclassified Tenacibaculum]QXP72579.1 hypothetical protein H0I30_07700 [Tenacibaculum sp. AHE14PA]QXP76493.1 hypothetical protein H0I31_02440 [Tenacibaculum sp. AHE15PA]
MILVSKRMVPKGFVGVTLYPFIFLKRKDLKHNAELVNHEKIHLEQQRELFIIFFFLFYFIEWFIKFLKYKDKLKAYKNLSFEREAYLNENNLYYIEKRKFWAFLNYL